MAVPLIQQVRVGAYVFKQRLRGNDKYPLVLMLEPLFRCNLACPGCGKIDYPDAILNRRLSVEECIEAVEECGAPVVSIPGGEPLIHKEIGEIVEALVARKKFVYLCTNALLLEKKLDLFKPTPYLTFSIHLDGLKDEHDRAVDQKGVFEIATRAIKKAAVGLKPPHSPVGTFFLVGRTGTGKTELAKAVARTLYDDPGRLVRIDCS